MNRREFLKATVAATALPRLREDAVVMSVLGPVAASSLGKVLPHEHVLVDFDRAPDDTPRRHELEAAERMILPHLQALSRHGVRTFVECTPAYLGRDPELLVRLARATGLHILTNTGYYGARDDRNLPPYAFTETADQLADRWIAEFERGIEGTGVRPGFIKIGVDAAPLSPVDRKLVTAAARVHRATGLTIASHTGPGAGAREQLAILASEGVHPSAWIWVHAQGEPDTAVHHEVARAGAWISFDGLSEQNVDRYTGLVSSMRTAGLLNRVLLSHDAGWYHVGEPGGGEYRPHLTLFTRLAPALNAEDVRLLTEANPAAAYTIRKRTV